MKLAEILSKKNLDD